MSFLIGIDGGGTKTILKIADLDGKIINSVTGGPCNINSSDSENIEVMLSSLLSKATRDIGLDLEDCAYLCIGTAGAGRENDRKRVKKIIRSAGYKGALKVTDDAVTVLRAGVEHEGIILVSGTGSICMGCTSEGKVARVGGWGHIIGDEGSGYAAAVLILKAVMHAYDGRGLNTKLKNLVLGHLDFENEEQLIAYVYQQGNGKNEIAEISEMLVPACEEGDSAAIAIIKFLGKELVEQVSTVAGRLGFEKRQCPLVISGGFINNNRFLLEEVRELIKQQYPLMKIEKLTGDAADGAVLLAVDELKNTYN
ncbi:MAG: BadF/BadG/BcrA/BcrD ATPase family protein [Bacillota bacterium]|nr:BadF/BadG/BcrA/BcrD ATPase family protein [Bacillota bacterium]